MSNVESVKAIYDAFGRGDVPAILDQLADDVDWDQDAPGYGIPIYEPGVGKEHAHRFFERSRISSSSDSSRRTSSAGGIRSQCPLMSRSR
jgi:ketosteroid isomerase-like protein